MGEGRAKVQALLLAVLVLVMSCSAVPSASSANCIPRRLLAVSGSSYRRAPCNNDLIDRPTPSGSDDDDHREIIAGSRTSRWIPPPPRGGLERAAGIVRPTPPGSIN
ncbi:uncharacterized protein [Zea mays]|uniref:Uncharacterized protein n=1 Tax=Zea mays TaxID=4577 RepID=A0A1D6H9V0_MAIZE|nr:uncharacterized protein LOC109939567 [Zea mays]AQK71483.1 hypothetical protein ZEAMMB73_Zm00001d016692 [Zea mays]|eukprot:XP_020393338.1 uncharacterized protein LOC109939567 [Zea mays]